MTTLDDLREFATPEPAEGGEPEATLVLWNEEELDSVLVALDRYFREDASRKAVGLALGEQEAGYLNRADFCSAESPDRGLSIADHMEVPGPADFRLLELRCPVPGCPTRKLEFIHDERHPEMCPRHPGQVLKVGS